MNLQSIGASADFTEGEESGPIISDNSSVGSTGPISNASEEEKPSNTSQLSVESTAEMMVIRLEAVDEDNYGSIIFALRARAYAYKPYHRTLFANVSLNFETRRNENVESCFGL